MFTVLLFRSKNFPLLQGSDLHHYKLVSSCDASVSFVSVSIIFYLTA
jgi:hypothetical protein